MYSTRKFLGLLFVAAALLALSGCEEKAQQPQQASQLPVVGTWVIQARTVPFITELSGRTSAFYVSEVRPQVSGIILERLFTEGSEVKEGQQLYQIDPSLYQAALDSAQAGLQRAQATYNSARLLAERYTKVVKVNGISKQQYDDAVAARNQAAAEVASAKSAVETARINLEYTKVLSPISGHIGQSSVTRGALVTANQAQPLALVQRLDQVYVDVTQSSTDILRLKRAMAEGLLEKTPAGGARVGLVLEDGSTYTTRVDGKDVAIMGELQFSDVTVDQGTGMVTLRALFPNPDRLLFAGMFVTAKVEEGVTENGILVPQQAVARDASGNPTALVLVNNPNAGRTNGQTGQQEPDKIIERRQLVVDRSVQGKYWLVSKGLAAGDELVVEGSQKVRPGGGAVAKPLPSPFAEDDAPSRPSAR